MELDGGVLHLEALHGELEELRQVAFEDGVAGLCQVTHLERILNFNHDWNELLVELAVFHDKGRAGRRREELHDFSDKVAEVGDTFVGRLEERVAKTGKVLEALGRLNFYLRRHLVSYFSCKHSEKVLHCGWVFDEGGPRCWHICSYRIVQGLV